MTFATPDELAAELKAGRAIILVDDESRENEGDLVIAADFADAKGIAFMAKEGSGLVCLALAPDICDRLGLDVIGERDNVGRNMALFMTPIEAKNGMTTGISAAERATTIKVAIDPKSTRQDIATPGHVFPLRAAQGGLAERQGHTEGAVDLCRYAGLTPAAVICEIMQEDGTMARRPQLETFAERWNLKIGTIDSIAAKLHKRAA